MRKDAAPDARFQAVWASFPRLTLLANALPPPSPSTAFAPSTNGRGGHHLHQAAVGVCSFGQRNRLVGPARCSTESGWRTVRTVPFSSREAVRQHNTVSCSQEQLAVQEPTFPA